jgi:hypothetical protein
MRSVGGLRVAGAWSKLLHFLPPPILWLALLDSFSSYWQPSAYLKAKVYVISV